MWKAIILMNIFVILSKSQKLLFKHIAADEVSVIEFCFFRSCWLLLATCLKFGCKRQNPFSGFPKGARRDMIKRSLSGQLTFALENFSFTLIPFAMALVLVGTTPFWVIIPAFFIMGETIMDIEVLGIFVCAVGAMLLTISWY